VSQSSEFCRHNPLCCFSTSVCFCCYLFRYRLSPETFGYTLVLQVHRGCSACLILSQRTVLLHRYVLNSFSWSRAAV